MILVTGGTGFVGRRLVEALAAEGCAVRVFTRSAAPVSTRAPGVEPFAGDLLDEESLSAAVKGVSTVIHLAASLPGSASRVELFRTNVAGTRNLAKAARAASVKLFVHGSTASV